MDRYAVVGHPIGHSRSPEIHAMFARATGQAMTYERLGPDPGGFEEAVLRFREEGGKGLNVTLPFKERAFALARSCSSRAGAVGAANTLDFRAEGIFADNTDGAGLIRDLTRNLDFSLAGQDVLLVGAGGAARGVLPALLDGSVSRIVVANRTPARALALLQYLGREGGLPQEILHRCVGCGFDALPPGPYALVINATSGSLEGEIPALPEGVYGEAMLVYDMVYGKEPTPFLKKAQALGARRTADGLGMLVEQAAESFYLWRQVYPDTGSVLQQLRSRLE